MKYLFIILSSFIFTQAFSQNLLIKQGHREAINLVKYSSDGKYIFSASDDKTIKVWDVKSGFDIKTFSGHSAEVKTFALTKSNDHLISGDKEGNIIIWDIHSAKIIKKVKAHEEEINTIVFYPDEHAFLTGSKDKSIKEWSFPEGVLNKTITENISSWVRGIGISPDGKRAIMGGHKTNSIELLLLDLEKGEVIDDIMKHWSNAATRGLIKAYTYAVLTPIALGLNVAKGNVGKDMLDFYINDFNNIQFTKDGESILLSQNLYLPLASSKENEKEQGGTTVWLIELSDDKNQFADVSTMKRWIIPSPGSRALFNKDQTKIIANEKFKIRIYDFINAEFPDSFKEANDYEPPVIQEFETGAKQISSIALSPDFKTVASTETDNFIRLWDIKTGRLINVLGGQVKAALAVDAFPDGKHILVGSKEQDMSLWDITTGQLVRVYDRSAGVNHIDISQDGTRALTTAENTDFFKLWDLQRGRLIRSFLGGKDKFVWVKFDNEDPEHVLAATEDGTIRKWSVVEGKPTKKVKIALEELEDKFTYGSLNVSFEEFKIKVTNGGNPLYSFEQKGIITDAVFSKDGRYLITSNEVGNINMYNLENGKLTLSMSQPGFNRFISHTPDYYYTSSKRAASSLAFFDGENVLPFEQLELKNNRPDIILKRIGYAPEKLVDSYYAAYQKRLERLGINEDQLKQEVSLPEILIDYEHIPYVSKEKKLKFSIKGVDDNFKIKKLQLLINDVPVYPQGGFNIPNPSKFIEHEFQVSLSGGVNVIKVYAINEHGFESLEKSFNVTYEKPYEKPSLYLLSVGVSDYIQDEYDLSFAAKDAKDIINTLSRSSSYNKVYHHLLTDDQVTKESIKASKKFVSKADVDDVVIIFIAGHGVLDSEYKYYFGTYNMDFSSPSARGISYEDIQDLLEGITSRKKVLFMDTCHSGELDEEDIMETKEQVQKIGAVAFRSGGSSYTLKPQSFGLTNTLELSKTLFGDLKKGTGATVISAAGGTEYAFEGLNSKNGLFTSCLLQGIETRRADLNRDRKYSVSEFQTYIYQKVMEYSDGAQRPTSREENIFNDFTVY